MTAALPAVHVVLSAWSCCASPSNADADTRYQATCVVTITTQHHAQGIGSPAAGQPVICAPTDVLLPPVQVKVSLAAVYGFMALVFPALLYFTGPLGLIKFWLMPWLG